MQDGIVEPVSHGLHVRLRRAVLDHARTERRRSFPPVLHVGVPGERSSAFTAGPGRRARPGAARPTSSPRSCAAPTSAAAPPLVWLARPGDLVETGDADLAWLAATRTAAGELGQHLPFVVVNRRAWRDPRTGVGRTWQRLRER